MITVATITTRQLIALRDKAEREGGNVVGNELLGYADAALNEHGQYDEEDVEEGLRQCVKTLNAATVRAVRP